MSVDLLLSCGGCDATAKVGPLHKRFHSLYGGGFGTYRLDDPEHLTPEGWVMFDPWTQATYCPACWTDIRDGAGEAKP